jgi:hypothetical protein
MRVDHRQGRGAGIRRRLQSAVFELIVEGHGYRQRQKPTLARHHTDSDSAN